MYDTLLEGSCGVGGFTSKDKFDIGESSVWDDGGSNWLGIGKGSSLDTGVGGKYCSGARWAACRCGGMVPCG